jgi:hypothetical protein
MDVLFKKFNSILEDRRTAFGLLLFLLLPAFLPALHGYFLHTDDYFWSHWGGYSFASKLRFMSLVGRPLGAFFYHLMSKIQHMSQFNIPRFFSFINICTLAFLTFIWFRSWKVLASTALFISVAIMTLPPYQVNVAYLSTVFYGMASTFAMLALLYAKEAWKQKEPLRRAESVILAVILLIVSFADYQPGAMFYLTMLSVPLILAKPQTFWKDWHKPICLFAAVMLGGVISYYVLVKIDYAIYFTNTPVGGKYDPRAFVQDYGERIKWFWNGPLFEAANLWRITPSVWMARFVFSLILLGPLGDFVEVCLESKLSWRGFASLLLKWVAIFALVPMTYSISLVSSTPSMEYRTYGPVTSLLLVLAFFGVYRWLDSSTIQIWKKKQLKLILPVLLACWGISNSSQSISDYFVIPDSAEFRSLTMAIKKFRRANGSLSDIHVIVGPPTSVDWLAQRNELGEPTLRFQPNVTPMVRSALSELGIRDPVRITISNQSTPDLWVEWVQEGREIFLSRMVPVPVVHSSQILVINRPEFYQ